MIKTSFNHFGNYKEGRILPTLNLDGNLQMAIDLMLLEKTITKTYNTPIIRFYSWDGPWLSIGKNQKIIPEKWKLLAKNKKLNIVRRPTGGSAVLHSGGLSYSLIWPSPPSNKKQAYVKSCQWLINSFEDLGCSIKFGEEKISTNQINCFASSTSADLIDHKGEKRIGNAQLWRKGKMLQHGEIILDPPSDLWVEIFDTPAPKPAPKNIPRQLKKLTKIFITHLNFFDARIDWQEKSLTKDELKIICKNAPKFKLSY